MKKSALIFAFVLACLSISAQAIWNKKLPITSIRPFADTRIENDHYWLTTGGEVLELDFSGRVTGYANKLGQPPTLLLSNFIKSNPNPQVTGKSFLVCIRGIQATGPTAYSISMFKPKEGFTVNLQLSDSLATSTSGPALVDINDHTFWVIGRKAVRQITISDQSELIIDWEKPLLLQALNVASAAVLDGDKVFTVTTNGSLLALDLAGNVLWTKSNILNFRGLTTVSNGLLACGSSGGNACLAKLNLNGDLVWIKTYADLDYNSLEVTPDGNIVATGKSGSNQIALLKTDSDGNEIWRQTYQNGHGAKVIATPDGGYHVLATSSSANRVYSIKTNELGETTPPEERILIRERNINNGGLSTTQTPTSSLFFNGTQSDLLLPADSVTSPVFVHSPWLAGKDAGGNLHLSVSTYGEFFGSDYRTGILSSPAEDFNRLWAVTREEIDQLRRDFGEDGDLDASPSIDMLSWPAKGNPHFQQNLDFTLVTSNPDSLPAAFVDFNGDGVYNVFDGDYPRLKGDRMLWWAMTDQAPHDESNSQPLGMDVLITLYAYDCPQNGSVSQSLFVEYQTINRSGQDYSDAYMGFHTDFDLGCDEDDYVGSMPEANTFYVHNQDAVDGNPGTSCPSGAPTYGEHIPVETITMLNNTLNHAMYFNRGGGGQGDPTAPIQFHNYLKSNWADGTPLTFGGSGYNPGNPTGTPVNFAFPDNPSDPQGWTMCTANLPQADRRMVNSHGPFSFAAADTFTMRLAFSFHPDIPHPCPDVAGLVKPTILQIQQWHDEGTLDAHLDLGSVLTLASGQSLILNATQSNPGTTYAWSTGQSTPSITVNQTGEYTVTVTPASGCAYSETVLVKSASGTSSPTLPTWQLQPNPATDVLRIVFEGAETPLTALLRNALGQTVVTQISTGNVVEISVANLPVGLYWAELWRDGKFLGSRKAVVGR